MEVSVAKHLSPEALAFAVSEIPDGFEANPREGFILKSAAPPVMHINSKRLWNDIVHTAKWGALPNSTVISRLALSEEDKCVRQWFIAEAKKLGCEIRIDEIGNIFAILLGTDEATAPIGIGSHLDTQPSGGRFDGVLGVIGALEVLRTIKDSGYKTRVSIAAINWTNEEGARFLPGCTGSSVWSGHTSLSSAYAQAGESAPQTLYKSLSDIDFVGTTPCSYVHNPLSAHFELHIEQGPLLERYKRSAGIVSSIQGVRRFTVTVSGQEGHAGTVAMTERADALVAAANMLLCLEKGAKVHSAVTTVGMLEIKNASVNKIPGEVAFSIDMRHPSEAILDVLEAELNVHMRVMEAEKPRLQFRAKRLWRSPAAQFDTDVLGCLYSSAAEVVGLKQTMEMRSFAGHDSALTTGVVPTAMLFVPSKDGISHAPNEWTSEADCGRGVQILLQAVLEYDKLLEERRSR